MLADRLKRYASAAVVQPPDNTNTATPAIADLDLPLSTAIKLTGTRGFAAAVETLALGDARKLHDRLCEADLSHALIWVELPAEEKERVREALLAARGLLERSSGGPAGSLATGASGEATGRGQSGGSAAAAALGGGGLASAPSSAS